MDISFIRSAVAFAGLGVGGVFRVVVVVVVTLSSHRPLHPTVPSPFLEIRLPPHLCSISTARGQRHAKNSERALSPSISDTAMVNLEPDIEVNIDIGC